jgi:uncharacterized protein
LIENLTMTFAIGIAAGIVGSMLGLGGGIIISPILALSGLLPPQVSLTSLFAVVSTGASSIVSYSLKKRINYAIGIKMATAAIPFAILGALVSSNLNPNDFSIYFAILLIFTSFYLFFRRHIMQKSHAKARSGYLVSSVLFYCASSTAGFVSSLFGIGGGIIFVPLLFGLRKLSMQESVATSQLSILITAVAGILTHSFQFQPDYLLAGSLAFGAIIGAQIGSTIAVRISERLLIVLFSFSLIIISVRLILDYFW